MMFFLDTLRDVVYLNDNQRKDMDNNTRELSQNILFSLASDNFITRHSAAYITGREVRCYARIFSYRHKKL